MKSVSWNTVTENGTALHIKDLALSNFLYPNAIEHGQPVRSIS